MALHAPLTGTQFTCGVDGSLPVVCVEWWRRLA